MLKLLQAEAEDAISRCIRCGFCLESCPTFVETGEETESPRGRIYLVRSAQEGSITWKDVRPHLSRCLGCLACSTACPSGVDYETIFEFARSELENQHPNVTKRFLLRSLTSRSLIKAQLKLGKLTPGSRIPKLLSKQISGRAPEVDKPQPQIDNLPPLEVTDLPPYRGEVYLLRGCVMDILYRRVHSATERLLERIGFRVRPVDAGCCGSLHAHNGYLSKATSLALGVTRAFANESIPVIVNSAGCGNTMKHYGRLLGAKGEAFSRRVFDASEFLLEHGLKDVLATSARLDIKATYHDACHLAHGQGVRTPPRELIQSIPNLTYTELPESDMCCGSAGIYNVTQPAMARILLERKYGNVAATGAEIIATGNPGCHAWIAQAAREHGNRVQVLHTMELLEASFSGLPSASNNP